MMDNKMKPGNALVETAQTTSLKAPLRTKIQDKAGEDAALIRDEERIMDEEITSDEESAAADKMERKLMTVALVKSVVESGSSSNPTASPEGSPRYGLRKRRRPAGDDLKRLEHSQATNTGGLARTGTTVTTAATTTTTSSVGRSRSGSKSTGVDWTSPPAISANSTVPNPLAVGPADPPPSASTTKTGTAAPDPGKILTAAVPCPLPASAPSMDTTPEVAAPLAAPPPPPAVDPPADKRKVTINEPSRSRGFSIDLESVGLDFPEESSSNAAELESGRGRAFSFECFAFGINADEPLPPLGHEGDGSSTGRPRVDSLVLEPPGPVPRPRGDSIIFDPSSFQEGGIHEQSALEKARAPSTDIPGLALRQGGAPKPDQTLSHPAVTSSTAPPQKAAVQPNAALSASTSTAVAIKPAPALPTPSTATATATKSSPVPPQTASSTTTTTTTTTMPAVTSYTATTTTTTTNSSTTTTTVTVTASSNTAALSMDLLNKDGRIGIYLPEARKARIARFHAKRARRIWRKRIKYDCRKKLADSRPRIKGRFVKRSDMEEE